MTGLTSRRRSNSDVGAAAVDGLSEPPVSILCIAADLDLGILLAAVFPPGGGSGSSTADAERAAAAMPPSGGGGSAWRKMPSAGEGAWAAAYGLGAVGPGPMAGGALFPVLSGNGGAQARVNFGGNLTEAPFQCTPPSADYRPFAAAAAATAIAVRAAKVRPCRPMCSDRKPALSLCAPWTWSCEGT